MILLKKIITDDLATIEKFKFEYRAKCDAIVIGKNFFLRNNPKLYAESGHPLRVVFCDLKVVENNHEHFFLFSDHLKRNTMVVTTDEDYRENKVIIRLLESKGIASLALKSMGNKRLVDPESFLKTMHSLKLNRILIEGGHHLAQSFMDKKLIDQIICY